MRAMILAAGLGKRMQPLTANLPKPLLKVAGKTLIEHQIERLVAGGVSGIVINHFYLGGMIEELLGNGSKYGTSINPNTAPRLAIRENRFVWKRRAASSRHCRNWKTIVSL